MTIGSTANIAFAFAEANNAQSSIDATGKLLLILIADQCAPGAAVVDLLRLGQLVSVKTPSIVHRHLLILAQFGLLNVSDIHEGKTLCSLPIATWDEVSEFRREAKCDWRFIRGPGEA